MTRILQTKTLLVLAAIAAAIWLLVSQIENHVAAQRRQQEQIQKDHERFVKELQEKRKKAPVATGFDDAFKRDLYK